MDESERSDFQVLVKMMRNWKPSSALTEYTTPKKPVGCSLRYWQNAVIDRFRLVDRLS